MRSIPGFYIFLQIEYFRVFPCDSVAISKSRLIPL